MEGDNEMEEESSHREGWTEVSRLPSEHTIFTFPRMPEDWGRLMAQDFGPDDTKLWQWR